MCPYALGRQSLRDSGQINGMFDRTVDKAVNLIDSEMTAVKEQTEDLVTDFKVIVAGVGQGPMSFKRQARYLVLHPGQTIYMPLGTIHHVFRKQSDPTLITVKITRSSSGDIHSDSPVANASSQRLRLASIWALFGQDLLSVPVILKYSHGMP
ncbi:hypothetical protein H9Q72_007582 [Fusarium xylarioides]|uniref:Uncharacterized protein n=1 Tax=Fusarium xylarioides TaxID=221167 RepID=A0A9P7L4K7_9HYPO|nr:hypothetical protein H9Q72_007582 [Fusarium xylarioides]